MIITEKGRQKIIEDLKLKNPFFNEYNLNDRSLLLHTIRKVKKKSKSMSYTQLNDIGIKRISYKYINKIMKNKNAINL